MLSAKTRRQNRIQSAIGAVTQLALLGFVLGHFFWVVRSTIAELNSDQLAPVALYRDLFVDHYPLSSWVFPGVRGYVPDLVFMFLAQALMPDVGYAYTCYALAALVLYGGLLAVITRETMPRTQPIDGLGVLMIGALYASCLKTAPFLREHWVPVCHGGSMVNGLMVVALGIRMIRRGRSLAALSLLGLLALVGVASDFIIVPQFLLPLAVSCGLLWLLHHTPTARRALGFGLILLGAAHIGYLLRAKLFWSQIGSQVIQYPVPWAILAITCVGSLSVAVHEAGRLRPSHTDARDSRCLARLFLSVFVLCSLDFTFMAPVVANYWFDTGSFRYLHPLFLLPPVWLVSFAPTRLRRWPTLSRLGIAWTGLALGIATTADGIGSLRLQDFRLPYPAQVACIDQVAKRHGNHAGFSDYWNAKYLTIHSRTGLRVNQITHALTRRLWINNAAWYTPRTLSATTRFVVTDRLDEAAIRQRWGQPQVIVHCAASTLFLYDFDLWPADLQP